MERLERPEQEITSHVETPTRSAFRQKVEVSPWSNSRLRTDPVRKRIAAERLRSIDVRLLFPDVSVQQVRVVARVTTRMQHANAKLQSRRSREHRRHRIASNLRVRQHIREVEVTRDGKRRVRRKAHSFPEWLGSIVHGVLARVFRILGFCKVRHGDTKLRCGFAAHTIEAHIHVVLKDRDKLAEDRAVRTRDIDLRTRTKVITPKRSFGLDDEPADRAFVSVLDWIRRGEIRSAKLDRRRHSSIAWSGDNVACVPLIRDTRAWRRGL